MKKSLLLLFFAISLIANAQTTYVPDDNFEQALIDLGYDTVLDDYVVTANITSITILDVSHKNISDLTGIEDFNSLQLLYCYQNNLTSLSITSNPDLLHLYCFGNDLTNVTFSTNQQIRTLGIEGNLNLATLDISNLSLLETLDISSTLLTSLDCSQNTNLKYFNSSYTPLSSINISGISSLLNFSCNYSNFEALDFSGQPNLQLLRCTNNQLKAINLKNGNNTGIVYLETTGNPDLNCIEVDLVTWSTNNLSTNIDAFTSFNTNCHYGETYVPDDNFEQALIDLGYDSGVLDNYVPTANIESMSTLDVHNKNIADLTGIEDFIGLNILYCYNNSLIALDVSAIPHLNKLYCGTNQIVSLDLSTNTHLYYLSCDHNQLTELNVKNGNNTNFTYFYASFNPNLYCIEVDSPAYSQVNWEFIDPASSFSINCSTTQTYVPDDNFEQKLITLGYDTLLDDYVTTANINTVTTLDLEDESISDLTGIEDFIALENFNCINNTIAVLEMTNNAALQTLECGTNQLTQLDLSQNPELTALYCGGNQLINLDLHNNTLLTTLSCSNNTLESLNVKNGNNTNFVSFGATNNPNLACIEVDDAAWSATNWTFIDATSNFSTDCNNAYTYVPDDNFEQALIDLGYDSGALNNFVPTANINTITTLDISSKSISDLTGIEDFVALTFLNCDSNQLTTIDISQLTALVTLNVSHNQFTTVNTDSNTALQYFYCGYNQITSLNLENNIALKRLSCYVNQLSILELDNNGALQRLKCQNNQLSSLDLSLNTALTLLQCQNNQLELLNLDNSASLTELNCHTNHLNRLSIKNGNNTNFTFFSSTSNPNLSCIQVDNASWSTTNWTNVDAISSFNEYCNYNLTYVPDDNFEQALIDLGYDSGALDDYVPTANINTITTLDISSKSISNLTGIEDFNDLNNLQFQSNNITSVDLSYNNALTYLNCFDNQLSSLDLTYNTALTYLKCTTNNLTSLDCSMLSNLSELYLANNQLSSLDVRNGNNGNISDLHFNVTNNINLTCILVDNASWSYSSWTHKDATATYVNDQAACNALYINETSFEDSIQIYPNPIKDSFSISNYNLNAIETLEIYDLLGEIVFKTNQVGGQISAVHLANGIYVVKLYSDTKTAMKKIIISK